MDALLKNATDSIRVGVDDYETRESARTLSAVRNLHAGLLLLAKWVLVRTAPKATEDDVIAIAYEPVPDGVGGVKYVPKGTSTIGLRDMEPRLKSFGLNLSLKAKKRLESLARVRNAVEHRYPDTVGESLRQTVSGAFVVAAELFRLGALDPADVVGRAWRVMLGVNEVYEKELAACRATFRKVEWKFSIPDGVGPECQECGSELVEQIEPDNRAQEDARGKCRSCGGEMDEETVVESLVGSAYWAVDYEYGDDPVLHACPSCSLETYVNEFDGNGEVTGCVVCGFKLGTCFRCGTDLTPDDRYDDAEDLCGSCGHMIAKEMERD